MAAELESPFLGGLPIQPQIRIGGEKGITIVFDTPDSEQAKIITEIARNLAAQINLRNLSDETSSKMEIILGDEE